MPVKIEYKFVPYGTIAPELLAGNEVWIDVGNRSDIQVFDHHGGDTNAKSAFELIVRAFIMKSSIFSICSDTVRLVCHINPDLDVISSAWLFSKILNSPDDIQAGPVLKLLEKEVSDNDQGFVRAADPESSWIIVMRLLLADKLSKRHDLEKVKYGMLLMEKTYSLLTSGSTLAQAAGKLISPEVRAELKTAQKKYQKDVRKAEIFQLELLQYRISEDIGQTGTADAILLNNPQSLLFKEMARGDHNNSPQKKGFAMLLVVVDMPDMKNRTMKRYIISTDPFTGFHLKGLGKRLEALEQRNENTSGLPLLKGRERVGKGLGRHGHNVASPWYDGRGHDFTIIDCPAVEADGKSVCASSLSLSKVKNEILAFSRDLLSHN